MAGRGFISVLKIGIVSFIAGCAALSQYGQLENSAREYSARGNHDQALFQVVQSLKLKPDYDKSQQLIVDVYPRAVEGHLEKVKAANSSNAKFKWDTVVAEYEALLKINQAVKSLPPLVSESTKQPIRFDIKDYSQDLVAPTNNAAEEHYQEGRRLFGKVGMVSREQAAKEFSAANKYVPGYKDSTMLAAEGYYQEGLILAKADDVDTQKKAAKSFKTAQEYVPGYKDSAALYEKARKAGIKRIAIIPFENKSGKGWYGAIADAIVDGAVSDVMNDASATEFLEIVSRDQLEQVMREQKLGLTGFIDASSATQLGKILGVKEIVTGKITQISVSPERTTPKRYRLTENVCVREDGNGKCIQAAQVYADVTEYTRTAGATITGSYSVIDVKTAAIKKQANMEGKYAFNAEWATYSGNETALGAPRLFGSDGKERARQLVRTSEQNAPAEEELVNNAREDLVTKLSKSFKDYAR